MKCKCGEEVTVALGLLFNLSDGYAHICKYNVITGVSEGEENGTEREIEEEMTGASGWNNMVRDRGHSNATSIRTCLRKERTWEN